MLFLNKCNKEDLITGTNQTYGASPTQHNLQPNGDKVQSKVPQFSDMIYIE